MKENPKIIIIDAEQSKKEVCKEVLEHTLRIIKQKRSKT